LLSIDNENLKVIHYAQNQGKGFAVKFGCMQAKGKYIGYTDADNDINVTIISEMYNRIKVGDVDMVIPSKFHKDSKINQIFKRKIFSKLFSLYTKLILFMPINDTQLGAKMFKKHVIKEVMPRVIIKRFAFDAEVLRVAFYYGFKKFAEVPVRLNLKTQSTVKIKDGLKSAQDILAIFYRLRIKRYYDLDRKFFLKESKFQFSKIIML
jgi:glycosyltransferase involved in cell wall biosynthesis